MNVWKGPSALANALLRGFWFSFPYVLIFTLVNKFNVGGYEFPPFILGVGLLIGLPSSIPIAAVALFFTVDQSSPAVSRFFSELVSPKFTHWNAMYGALHFSAIASLHINGCIFTALHRSGELRPANDGENDQE